MSASALGPRHLLAKRLLEEGRARDAMRALTGVDDLAGLAILTEAATLAGDLDAARSAAERAVRLDPGAPGLFERWMRLRSAGVRSADAAFSLGRTLPTTSASGLVLVREIGRGGAAVVYEADDAAHDRKVALKVYHQPRDHRAQLTREVDVALAVAGRGVARVFDADVDEGWVQLEWANGGVLSRQNVSDALVARLVAALRRVHDAGWIHGDLKPANVLIDARGAPLLSDFGLAVRPGDAYRGATPGFASPERVSGRAASFDDDFFALEQTLRAVDFPLSAAGLRRILEAKAVQGV